MRLFLAKARGCLWIFFTCITKSQKCGRILYSASLALDWTRIACNGRFIKFLLAESLMHVRAVLDLGERMRKCKVSPSLLVRMFFLDA
jgi:hypothetical protein